MATTRPGRRRPGQPLVQAAVAGAAGWMSLAEAREILDVETEDVVRCWAELRLLRSRALPSGELQVLHDDVLYRRAERAGLAGIGGDDLTPEELEALEAARPDVPPWKQTRGS